tara:strand:- start:494 stop:658 length:165 start_codon:yes stop_codon:yes gene_type:complete
MGFLPKFCVFAVNQADLAWGSVSSLFLVFGGPDVGREKVPSRCLGGGSLAKAAA